MPAWDTRIALRGHGKFADKLPSAMGHEFGGHIERPGVRERGGG